MIDIYFEYKGETVTLPVNPEELSISLPGNNENADVVGLGEVNILRRPRLCPISISSFFPEDSDPQSYVDFFHRVQRAAAPMRIVCNEFALNMRVGIDGFEHSIRAGEEGDRYYTLELQEYKSYAPTVMQVSSAASAPNTTQIPTPPTNTSPITEFSIGETVTFGGGNHYVASTASGPNGGNRTAGKAKITNKASTAPHPYHLIGIPGGSNVYGWVDRGQVSR